MIRTDVIVNSHYVATVECMYATNAINIMHALSEVYHCTFKVELIGETGEDADERCNNEDGDFLDIRG